jgi:hypothetical protein
MIRTIFTSPNTRDWVIEETEYTDYVSIRHSYEKNQIRLFPG